MKKTAWFLASVLMASTALAGSWEGVESMEDGVLHIRNTETPQTVPGNFALTELWRRGGDDDDLIFGITGRIITDNASQTYVLDTQLSVIHVFNIAGEHIRIIGGEGDGPGEFRLAGDLFFTPGGNVGVAQLWPSKILQMTPGGDPLSSLAMPTLGGIQLTVSMARLAGDHLVIGGNVSKKDAEVLIRTTFIRSLAESGDASVAYFEMDNVVDMSKLTFLETDIDGVGTHWALGNDGRVYCPTSWDKYLVTVWNADGTRNRIIEKEYKPLTRTRDDHDRLSRTTTMWINGHEASFETQKYSRTVRDVYPRPDGSLWVLSDRGSRVRADGFIAQFDEFDAQGRFVRMVNLSGDADLFEDGFYINDDFVYIVKGLTAAKTSLHAADEEQGAEAEADALMVVCYRLTGS